MSVIVNEIKANNIKSRSHPAIATKIATFSVHRNQLRAMSCSVFRDQSMIGTQKNLNKNKFFPTISYNNFLKSNSSKEFLIATVGPISLLHSH